MRLSAEETKYVHITCEHNVGWNYSIKMGNNATVKYLRTIVTNQNCKCQEIKSDWTQRISTML